MISKKERNKVDWLLNPYLINAKLAKNEKYKEEIILIYE